MTKFKEYQDSLCRVGNKIWSYNTHVATIKDDKLIQLGSWSQTTQKHINYVGSELELTLIR